MWLYVPTSSASSPVPEVLTSPSDSLCRTLAVSAMSRGKLRQSKFWRLALRTRLSTTRLCGLTSAPSTVSRGVDLWMESLAASRARTYPSQESAGESSAAIAPDSGSSTPGSFGRLNPDGSISKTSPDYSREEDPDFHAYVAGLIDGEGCIGIREQRISGKVYYRCTLEIGMTMKAIPILNRIHAELGGSLNISRSGTKDWEAAASWKIQGEDLLRVIEKVYRHLHLKKGQADIAKEMLSLDSRIPKVNGKRPWDAVS